MTTKPIPLGMLICDTVIQDAKTQKKSLIGIFSQIHARKAPVRHPHMSVFLVVTEGHGSCSCELRCLRADSDKPLMSVKGEIAFRDPHQTLELVFDLNGIIFPDFGSYRLEFWVGDHLVIARKLMVSHRPPQKK
ncbi:MAG: DUF6941 family protein [Candidatus Omnitrophota bacterium]